ncbi:MAG: aldo/keto reductase, partial [Acidobacteriota bacterium]
DEETDELYLQAIVCAVDSGCNVLDTAINYRCQRSERNIGEALRELARKGIGREQVVVATKGGFVPFQGAPPANVDDYVEKTFFSTGVLSPQDVVSGRHGSHAMTPGYLENQLEQSRSNLGLDTIDVYYLHNPEIQLGAIAREELMRRLRAAFGVLEEAADKGRICFYGTATWSAYRRPQEAQDYLSMESLESLARDVAGDQHRFRFVQLPYSLAMTEAFTACNQVVRDRTVSAFQAAEELGLHIMSSASICQGRLTRGLPDWFGTLFKGFSTDAQRSIQFARSTPGLTTALVGMKQIQHVEENLAVAKVPPSPLEDILKLFEVDNQE